jgi:HicA toxin of bacterial toxin-antitoxin,
MNRKHRATLAKIFARPVPANLAWRDIEALLSALGATIEECGGSMVAVKLRGVRAVFQRPHPRPEAKKGAVRAVRIFPQNAGVEP